MPRCDQEKRHFCDKKFNEEIRFVQFFVIQLFRFIFD